jgi:uridylate kinase
VAKKTPKYRRVLLKLSGEALGDASGGFNIEKAKPICRQIAALAKAKVQLAIVVGGGNWIRGRDLVKTGMSDSAADTMGMLATVINGVALQDALESAGVATRLQTAIPMHAVAEPFIRRRCISHLEGNKVVVLAAGTGHPHFTTDTAAALRAREIQADVVLKATNVDGVYDDDPNTNPKAKLLRKLSYEDVLHNDLKVMDAAAVTLCREGKLPVLVFNLLKRDSIKKAVYGERIGTIISG